ncbi:MAG: HEAT repeat domain-containing protein [Candidatus Thermoplasmatota archaeon]|nr:HEAT repeat domain-containing protein [Candidatus Thermoplasmatota archaeon]
MFKTIDDVLVRYSRVFGTSIRRPMYQHLVLLTSFSVIHFSAFYSNSLVTWTLLWLGFLGVIGVGRAWVSNEKRRSAIARKLSDDDPDALPDLRISALVSALQLFIIIPLLLKSSHDLFDLYVVPPDATLKDWLLLGVDLLFRSILDWSEIYGVKLSSIDLDTLGGRHLIMLFLLTIDFILIQGIIRIFDIRRTISEGVAAAIRDPEMAYRLGVRAVPSLLDKINDQNVVGEDCKHIIEALAVLKEKRASEQIISRFNQDDVRTTAVAAMVTICDLPPLFTALKSDDKMVQIGAITALRRIGLPSAVAPLTASMQSDDSTIREEIVRAFSAIGKPAHPQLRNALLDTSKRVRLTALQGLALDSSEQLMHHLIEMTSDPDADIRLAAIDAMQRITDGRVVKPLANALQDVDERVAKQAQRSLDHLESVVSSKGTSSDQ